MKAQRYNFFCIYANKIGYFSCSFFISLSKSESHSQGLTVTEDSSDTESFFIFLFSLHILYCGDLCKYHLHKLASLLIWQWVVAKLIFNTHQLTLPIFLLFYYLCDSRFLIFYLQLQLHEMVKVGLIQTILNNAVLLKLGFCFGFCQFCRNTTRILQHLPIPKR